MKTEDPWKVHTEILKRAYGFIFRAFLNELNALKHRILWWLFWPHSAQWGHIRFLRLNTHKNSAFCHSTLRVPTGHRRVWPFKTKFLSFKNSKKNKPKADFNSLSLNIYFFWVVVVSNTLNEAYPWCRDCKPIYKRTKLFAKNKTFLSWGDAIGRIMLTPFAAIIC